MNMDFWKRAYEKSEWHSEWCPGMLLDKTYIVSCKINNLSKILSKLVKSSKQVLKGPGKALDVSGTSFFFTI